MKKAIPTPHISAENTNDIAKVVIMPGDPLRAKYIAEYFLSDIKQVNTVRNMLGYTGSYNGREFTVMGSGMGMPSIGIYSYELFNFYDVETIIRVGSAGSYTEDLNLYDVVLATSAWSESSFALPVLGEDTHSLAASSETNEALIASAARENIEIKQHVIHSSDVFYRKNFDDYKTINAEHDCACVEMESFALFANARVLNKKAACLLTISDSLVKGEATSAEERETKFMNMVKVALNAEY